MSLNWVVENIPSLISNYNKISNDNGTLMVNDHEIEYHLHGRFHTLVEYVWDGEVTDKVTGKVGKSRHLKSKQGALEHALRDLAGK